MNAGGSSSVARTASQRSVYALIGCVAAALAILLFAASAHATCYTNYSCQYYGVNYTSYSDAYRAGFGDFRQAHNNAPPACGNWFDCQGSTYDGHTTCDADWWTGFNGTGRRLIDHPTSGSPNLTFTYEGYFFDELASLTVANC